MNLATALPKGEGNGLTPLIHDQSPTVRVKRVEAITGDDLKVARRLLDRAYEQRLGGSTLPFELEEDLRSAFGGDQ